jgi:hypothetical protein
MDHNRRQGARVPSFGTQGCRNGNPSETMCTHCGEVRAFALRGCSRRRLSFSRGAPPHFLLIKSPPSFRLFLFHTPDYLALLPASEFHHCDKPLLSLLRPIGFLSVSALCSTRLLFCSQMAKLNSARNFFERARMMTVGSFSVS